jgi:DNA-binding NarL/FixJ family response regulator
MSIRLVLASDHRVLLEALRSMLAQGSDIEVVGHAAELEGVITLARDLTPDIVLVEAEMAGAQAWKLPAGFVANSHP